MITRAAAPMPVKTAGRRLARSVGRATAGQRLLPRFLIVGAQRCGTTSLFRALAAHPDVLPPLFHKCVHFFDINYDKGFDWYRGHFPLRRVAERRIRAGVTPTTGESSPYYLHHPLAAERIATHLPDVRLIALLRDPVERAYSAHRHELARGYETEEFERALDLEPQRLAGEEERLAEDPTYRSFSHQHQAYVTRGEYARQLERLAAAVGWSRVLVLDSETFFTSPEQEYARALRFLGLRAFTPERFDQHNARPRSPMPDHVRQRLEAHFAPHDDHLARILGHQPGWRS